MTVPPLPRAEYPRPQFRRERWLNLNGPWSFSYDYGRSGFERGLAQSTGFDQEIIVPFCPESSLSGIAHTDFLDCLWYHRSIEIPDAWLNQQILLHFGAVDYETHVYIDGRLIYSHFGGSVSFSCNITQQVKVGHKHHLVLHVKDDIRSSLQAGGKQSLDYYSAGCFYTRVSGIWQTVWMEAVNRHAILQATQLPDLDLQALHIRPEFLTCASNLAFKVSAWDGDREITSVTAKASNYLSLTLNFGDALKVWEPNNPYLYDLSYELVGPDGETLDYVRSYAGVRKIHVEGDKIFLNNEPLFLRLILDQGFYQGGIWTAPTDEALRRDIELGKEAGFNGARLHQKIFEERYHYWADVLGYLTWAESPSWGLSMKSDTAARNFLAEWGKIVCRDRNHPSIVAWTPLNETWDVTDPTRHRRLHVDVYELTKLLDPTRPVNGASGGCQVITDLYTVHNYEQDPAKLQMMLTKQGDGSVYATLNDKEVRYSGQPYLVDEFGGIKWVSLLEISDASEAWGYGDSPRTLEEFYTRLSGQVNALLALPHISGYCYTQLTDVEQEQNGIYNYDRSSKFDMNRIRKIFQRIP